MGGVMRLVYHDLTRANRVWTGGLAHQASQIGIGIAITFTFLANLALQDPG